MDRATWAIWAEIKKYVPREEGHIAASHAHGGWWVQCDLYQTHFWETNNNAALMMLHFSLDVYYGQQIYEMHEWTSMHFCIRIKECSVPRLAHSHASMKTIITIISCLVCLSKLIMGYRCIDAHEWTCMHMLEFNAHGLRRGIQCHEQHHALY